MKNQYKVTVIVMFLAIFVLTFLFYHSVIVSTISMAGGIFFISYIKGIFVEKKKQRMEEEFKEFLYTVSSIYSVGKSLDVAVATACDEMIEEGGSKELKEELVTIKRELAMNVKLEDIFDSIFEKYEIDSIRLFVELLRTEKRQGTSLRKIIDDVLLMITEKVEVRKELDIITTQKRYEFFIMLSFVPLMILYLLFISEQFSLYMYHTIEGRVVMTISFGIYIASMLIGKQIVDIKI